MKTKAISKKFESLTALSSFLASASPCGAFNQYNTHSHKNDYRLRNRKGMYFNSESFEAANDLMLQGWHEGAKRVQSYMTSAAGATTPKRVIYNSVVGFAPNVPNYLAGNPLNMINQRRVKTPKKVVTIVYNCAVGFDIPGTKIERTAAALFNVISGLESSGVRVELYVGYFVYTDTEQFNALVKIKSAGQPFNLLKMVYPVVHPSFMRRHCLYLNECSGVSDIHFVTSGGSLQDDHRVKKSVVGMGVTSDNIFSYYLLAGKSESQIAKMIK